MIFMTVIIRFMDDIIGDLMENPVDIIEDPMKILWISVPDSKNRTSDSMTILCAIPVGTFAACSNPTVVTDVCRPFPLFGNGMRLMKKHIPVIPYVSPVRVR
jgi:hypothetical protein